MKIYKNVTELIGTAPLVYLSKVSEDCAATVIGKLEYFNPAGSCKDKIALNMINRAEEEGKIIPGVTTLLEATSGNTGIALAMVSAVKGYRLIIIMPENMSEERKLLLRAYGAELVETPANAGMKGAIEKMAELHKKIENSFIMNQFGNPANPEIHRNLSAEKIWEETDGKIDMVVAGVGTGGTITGIAQRLKEKKPEFKAVAVEPSGNAVLSCCECCGCHIIQGIGTGFIPSIYDKTVIDEVFQVDDIESVKMARRLAKEEGILCGFAGGAAVYAAIEIAKRPENAGKLILAVISDTGERYLSTELFREDCIC